MRDGQPKAIQLSDYTPPEYYIAETALSFDIYEEHTIVTSTLVVNRNTNTPNVNQLTFQGQELELLSVELNGRKLDNDSYQIDDKRIIFI